MSSRQSKKAGDFRACLSEVDALLDAALGADIESKFRVLELVSAQVGGYGIEFLVDDLSGYDTLKPISISIKKIILKAPFHHALILASLAELESDIFLKRTSGSYFSDYRLANFLAGNLRPNEGLKILDPACGSGILLVGAVLHFSTKESLSIDDLLQLAIFGSDISTTALRGARLSLSSMTSNGNIVSRLKSNLRQADALKEHTRLWADVTNNGFSCVIANPPWEKLSLRKHELGRAVGFKGSYGSPMDKNFDIALKVKAQTANTANFLKALYLHQGNGERDLYKLFLELCVNLLSKGGSLSVLLPAGLIRSKGTLELRKLLFANFSALKFSLFDNRPRFFDIDSRFKFLAVIGCKDEKSLKKIGINYPKVSDEDIDLRSGTVSFSLKLLTSTFSTLLVPELKPGEELLFGKFIDNGIRLADSVWLPEYTREVDMTLDKKNFLSSAGALNDVFPILEGRMVSQYNSSAKAYLSGSGRSAIWVCNKNQEHFFAQYFYPVSLLKGKLAHRVKLQRVGFCDISGQTNERTMLSALIPQGVVCGNKVPTILFESLSMAYVWIAISNSFAFDWFLRRMVTTSVNYFLLQETRFPKLEIDGLEFKRLAHLSRELSSTGLNPLQRAYRRLEIDKIVFDLFGLTAHEVLLLLTDFKSLDRSQKAIPGETKSTITKDFIMSELANSDKTYARRLDAALKNGAIPYLSSTL